MKVMVWNVNGLRACCGKGFVDWVGKSKPAVLGLQEVRAFCDQVEPLVEGLKGWKKYWNPAKRPGYSGVALFSRDEPLDLQTGLGIEEFDVEGRVQIADYGRWVFFNTYFPKGSGSERDNSRVPYKLAFYEALIDKARDYRGRGKSVVIGGDFNTAHTEIDLRNPKTNQKTSGFLPEERAWIDRYLGHGFADVFRVHHPDEPDHYTWWSQRMGARKRNVGWRIDYLLVSDDAVPHVRKTWIEPHVLGSDHCPVGIDLVLPRRAASRRR